MSPAIDLVFVYPNYRTNAFGFLPGKEVAADPTSDLNPGLLDQDAALRWTRDYVAHFGGDPENVSIWGQSAGGGSVVAQVIANHSRRQGSQQPAVERPLFRAALASSPYWPKTYAFDAPEAQWQYDALANLTGCAGPGSLACLKRADVQRLRDAALTIAGSHTYNTSSYTWAPVIDGQFLDRPLSEATGGKGGGVELTYGFGMYNTHEGENFTPPGLDGVEKAFDSWLGGFLPGFSADDLRAVRQLYPPSGSAEAVANYSNPATRAGLIYRDVVLACPAYWMAGAASKGSWLGEYSISPAKHASDTYWVRWTRFAAKGRTCDANLHVSNLAQWNHAAPEQQTDRLHYLGYVGAFASFFITGDPNARKLTNSSILGVPALESGAEFNINKDGFSHLSLPQLRTRCDFWKKMAPKVPM